MVRYRNSLQFLDLILLKVIIEYFDERGESPSQNALIGKHGLVNTWIDKHNVNDVLPDLRLGNRPRLQSGAHLLRHLGFLTEDRLYTPSDAAYELFDNLDPEWKRWPVLIPIVTDVNGAAPTLDLSHAVYVLE